MCSPIWVTTALWGLDGGQQHVVWAHSTYLGRDRRSRASLRRLACKTAEGLEGRRTQQETERRCKSHVSNVQRLPQNQHSHDVRSCFLRTVSFFLFKIYHRLSALCRCIADALSRKRKCPVCMTPASPNTLMKIFPSFVLWHSWTQATILHF